MSDEKKTIKLRFKDDFKSPTLDLGHGEYNRKFDAKDQPFQIVGVTRTVKDRKGNERDVVVMTAADEAALLLDTGHFVVVEESVPPAAAGGLTDGEKAAPGKSAVKTGTLQNEGRIGGASASDKV